MVVTLTKSERKQLVELIQKATINKTATDKNILAVAIQEGYSKGTVCNILNTLYSCGLLEKTATRESHESKDTTYIYKWNTALP